MYTGVVLKKRKSNTSKINLINVTKGNYPGSSIIIDQDIFCSNDSYID